MTTNTIDSTDAINTDAMNDRAPADAGAQLADDGRTIEGGITVVPEVDNALVVTNPEKYAKDLFEPFYAELTTARRRASRANYDITTPAGMEAAKLLADTFTKIRTRADKLKTERKKPIDQAGKAILTAYNALADAAKAEQDKHDKAIRDEKARLEQIEQAKRDAERARIEAIEQRLAHIRGIPAMLAKADAALLQTKLDELLAKQLDPALYNEFLEQAAAAMIETTDAVRQLLTEATEREARDARLKQLEAEEEARKAKAEADRKANEEAAANLKRQQDQMTEMAAIQAISVAAPTIETREQLAAELAKVQNFDPASYGTMQPLADMARTMALTALEKRLAELPEPEPEPAPAAADPVDLEPTPAPIMEPVAAPSPSPSGPYRFPSRRIPAPVRPTDLAILEAVAAHFGVPGKAALGWLATVDIEQLRAQLEA